MCYVLLGGRCLLRLACYVLFVVCCSLSGLLVVVGCGFRFMFGY